MTVKGIENLPKDGLYTFVSNHPLGEQDGVALGYVLGKHYDGKVKYLVNDLLMNLRGLAPLCIPINKTGKQAKDFPKMVEAGFQSDDQLIMFPAGLCSRRQNGVIRKRLSSVNSAFSSSLLTGLIISSIFLVIVVLSVTVYKQYPLRIQPTAQGFSIYQKSARV